MLLSKSLRFLILLLLLLVAAVLPTLTVDAQTQAPVEVLEHKETYSFGGQITFWARVQMAEQPTEALIFYRSKGDERALTGALTISDDQVVFVHDLTQQPLRAFAETEYWFGFILPDGEMYISPTYTFTYIDNRFEWQSLEAAPFTVSWYEGGMAFGQFALDAAENGYQRAQTLMDLPELQPVNLYIYASGAEMQSTLRLGSMAVVGGHASPDLSVMIVSLPAGPDQRMETERQVPHELVHVLLFQKLGRGYENLPTWLNEGLASQNEPFPNPDYSIILADAVKREALLPMASLCQGFPRDAASFFQAYAQSDSFVRYLHNQFGRPGLEALLQQYADGVDCERGMQLGLGSTLSELDEQWRQDTFGFKLTPVSLDNPLYPWLALAGFVLVVPLVVVVSSLVRPTRRKPAVGGSE